VLIAINLAVKNCSMILHISTLYALIKSPANISQLSVNQRISTNHKSAKNPNQTTAQTCSELGGVLTSADCMKSKTSWQVGSQWVTEY